MTTADNPVDREFTTRADPFRRELLAHCYRMLGSVHDAEDLVQETYLRAWRAYDRFEGRSTLRTWLYRIATSACLTALESRGRRALPTGLGPASDPEGRYAENHEVPWLEPVPDAAVGADAADPASIVTSRESIRLALVAALQHLPPRQRAVLILRDVLAWRAAEVAEVLGTTTAAVNSILQRARAQLEQVAPREDAMSEPTRPEQHALLNRYVSAFEARDVAAIVELFTADAMWEMPPYDVWFAGVEAIGRHLKAGCESSPGDVRLVATAANGQPAFGTYLRGEDGALRATSLQVLALRGDGIGHVSNFLEPELFARFGLPEVLPG